MKLVLSLLSLLICFDLIYGSVQSSDALDFEISRSNLTSNMNMWYTDMAVMFYAPWCNYCKQLKPSWSHIASINHEKPDIIVGTFDCDLNALNTELCRKIGVDRYPSIYYFGYGSLNLSNSSPNNTYKEKAMNRISNPKRVVRYVADLYPDRIFDWVRMLRNISRLQRFFVKLSSLFR